MRYWPVPSVTAGSMAPEASLTVPASATCAHAALGRIPATTASIAVLSIVRIHSTSIDSTRAHRAAAALRECEVLIYKIDTDASYESEQNVWRPRTGSCLLDRLRRQLLGSTSAEDVLHRVCDHVFGSLASWRRHASAAPS